MKNESNFFPATINQQDPLNPEKPIAPDSTRELFKRLSQLGHGFSLDDAIGAAANLLINGVRQKHARRAAAEKEFDEIVGRAKNVLLEGHYDGAGDRRNVFPFDQVVNVPHMDFRKRQ